MTDVTLEVGKRRAFAVATRWPGWGRSGRTADAALETLAAYLDRYEVIVADTGLERPTTDFDVVSQVEGNATTDFGAPGVVGPKEGPLGADETERRLTLLQKCWDRLEIVAAQAPEGLRKGPRGGGRDTSAIVAHVEDAERAYAAKIGVRSKGMATDELRTAIGARLRDLAAAPESSKWPASYFVGRTAWHVTDHLWEIEDRID